MNLLFTSIYFEISHLLNDYYKILKLLINSYSNFAFQLTFDKGTFPG